MKKPEKTTTKITASDTSSSATRFGQRPTRAQGRHTRRSCQHAARLGSEPRFHQRPELDERDALVDALDAHLHSLVDSLAVDRPRPQRSLIRELAVGDRAFTVGGKGLSDRRHVTLKDVARIVRIVLGLYARRRDGEPGHDECPERTEGEGGKQSIRR